MIITRLELTINPKEPCQWGFHGEKPRRFIALNFGDDVVVCITEKQWNELSTSLNRALTTK